jgi:hypothetical protein
LHKLQLPFRGLDTSVCPGSSSSSSSVGLLTASSRANLCLVPSFFPINLFIVVFINQLYSKILSFILALVHLSRIIDLCLFKRKMAWRSWRNAGHTIYKSGDRENGREEEVGVYPCGGRPLCQDLQAQQINNHFYILKQVQINIHWTVRSMQCFLELQHRFKMKMLIYSTGKLNTCYSTKTFQRFCFKLEASLRNALIYVYAFHLLVMFSFF